MKVVSWNPADSLTQRAARAERQSSSQQALRRAAQEFEALFLQQMLTAMRGTVAESDLLGDRGAEKTFEYMLDEERSKDMAKAGGIGLGEVLYRQMLPFVPADD